MISSFFRFLLPSLLCGAILHGQEAAPATPAPGERVNKHKGGYLRLWNMLPRESGEFLILKDNAAPDDPLLAAAPTNYYASYIGLPNGRYHFKLVRTVAPQTIVDTVEVTIRGGDSYTILLSAPDRKLKIETIEETFDMASSPLGRLTIRQLFPGAKVSITLGQDARSHELVPGDVEVLKDLPLKLMQVKMRATFPDGSTQNWTTEVDFPSLRHAAILLVADVKGHCRPRVTLDGHPAPPLPEGPGAPAAPQ